MLGCCGNQVQFPVGHRQLILTRLPCVVYLAGLF